LKAISGGKPPACPPAFTSSSPSEPDSEDHATSAAPAGDGRDQLARSRTTITALCGQASETRLQRERDLQLVEAAQVGRRIHPNVPLTGPVGVDAIDEQPRRVALRT
jgi:hypothetical protein